MPRLILFRSDRWLPRMVYRTRRAFTLIEILVAMAITLVMMAAVVNIFDGIGSSINDSRATIEMTSRLRGVRNRLQTDLASTTAPLLPWTRPEAGVGYFEYVEGFLADGREPHTYLGAGSDTSLTPLSVLGDYDDVLMFTARSRGEPFVGRSGGGTIESKVAEVIWYAVENDGSTGIAGLRTIYRRVLLVAPWAAASFSAASLDLSGLTPEVARRRFSDFQNNNDISARIDGARIVLNTLGDVTKRENRFWHTQTQFPYALPQIDPTSVDFSSGGTIDLQDAGPPNFVTAGFVPGMTITVRNTNQNDVNRRISAVTDMQITIDDPNIAPLNNESAGSVGDPVQIIGYPVQNGDRAGEDVMLTNVLAFDVMAYDPHIPLYNVAGTAVGPIDYEAWTVAHSAGTPPVIGQGAYIDIGFVPGTFAVPTVLSGATHRDSQINFIPSRVRVYDTWSFHYEHDGRNQDGDADIDEGTDGFDNNDANGVDDIGERETSPPYPVPLRGVQVRIRVYEPDSRSIREVSINQHFVPE